MLGFTPQDCTHELSVANGVLDESLGSINTFVALVTIEILVCGHAHVRTAKVCVRTPILAT